MQTGLNSGQMLNNEGCSDSGIGLSKAETEVYDRQIRLWGIEAQKKLHVASGLVCGLSGLGAEIAKNLMLCGLQSLTLMDDKTVTLNDLDSNFLLDIHCVGKNRAKTSSARVQSLNPMVKLEVVESSIADISSDFLSQFTVVVLCDQPYDVVVMWNDMCRNLNIRFVACSVFGWMGYSFFDFNNHLFLKDVTKIAVTTYGCNENGEDNAVDVDAEHGVFEKTVMHYPRFEDTFNIDWSKKRLTRRKQQLIPCSYFLLRAMLRAQREKKLTDNDEMNSHALTELWSEEVLLAGQDIEKQPVLPEKFDYFFGPQLSPVCAIVGGLAAQEAIKALSENENPLKNVFIYSAFDSYGTICNFLPSQ